VDELKMRVRQHREMMGARDGNMIVASAAGPVSFSLIDDVVRILEAQQKRLDDIEKRAALGLWPPPPPASSSQS
jgi:hypothetical protein